MAVSAVVAVEIGFAVGFGTPFLEALSFAAKKVRQVRLKASSCALTSALVRFTGAWSLYVISFAEYNLSLIHI